MRSDFHLGAAYEGPPGSVHGGVLALVLDQMLGEAAGAGGKPGMTATLTLTYRQRTPLGDLQTSAWIEKVDGIKTWARGEIVGPEGVTVEAEGLFILPKWAREAIAQHDPAQPDPVLLRVAPVRSAVASTLTPRSPASVSRASSAAMASSSARRASSCRWASAVCSGAGRRDQVLGAVVEAGERHPAEDLLLGGGALGPAAAQERDRPVHDRGDPVLEAGDVEEVHDQPHQPGDEPGEPEVADHARPPGTG